MTETPAPDNSTRRKPSKAEPDIHEIILTAMREPMAVIDASYTFLMVNRSYEDFWDVPKAAIIGKRVHDILGEDVFERTVKPNVDRCLAGETVRYGAWFRSPKKGERYMDLNYYPYKTENGEIIGLINIAYDFTEQKRYEDALRESEERFRALVEAGPMSIFMLRNGKYVYANPAGAKLLGYDNPDDIVGGAALDTIAPEFHAQIRDRICRVESGENNPPMEIRLLRPDGGSLWSLSTSVSISVGGQPTAVIMGQDITELKSARTALRETEAVRQAMTEHLPAGIMLIDAATHAVESVNTRAERILGLSGDDILGRSCQEFMCPSEEGGCPVRRSGRPRLESAEMEVVRKDGNRLSVLKSITPVSIGGSEKLLECFIDITAQKQLETRLRQAEKMESIWGLAGGIAHDFNNLLSPIIGLSELLLEDLPAGSPVHENVEEILNAGMRGRDLVKQILAFSRRSEHTRIPVHLQKILKEILKLTRATIPSYIDISEHVQADCGRIMADPTQIHQVVMNIMTNAFHAMAVDGGTIVVRLTEKTAGGDDSADVGLEPGRYALLSIADTGCGISAEHMDKIFEPYFTTKEKDKGTGLGLAVAYGIVKAHGGDIKVFSEPGKGTTFDIYLPLMPKTGEAESLCESRALAGGDERILLVDDEAPIAGFEAQMLERLGYRVTLHTGSVEALATFKANPRDYDLVLTDMAMPDMAGDQLAAAMLAIRPDTPIIVCTGFSERINQEKADALGIKGFLMKPVVRSELAGIVRKVLDERQQPDSR